MLDNIMLKTDGYKVTHWQQYPPGTETVYSYMEARGGPPTCMLFGLQYIMQKHLMGRVVDDYAINKAAHLIAGYLGPGHFNEAGWRYIHRKHDGMLPIRIKAIPEGMVVPVHTPLFTVENTDPNVPWLTNYVETLLMQSWYPSTVAHNSRECKLMLAKYLRRTACSLDNLPYMLHDFGFRGVSSAESAAIGAAAHLVNFRGTDTIAGIELAQIYYLADQNVAASIPAAEHSTITAWGKEHEVDAYRNMLEKFPGAVAVVSDSYDIYHAVSEIWGGTLKGEVLGHEGTVVIRPDSGDPKEVVSRVVNRLGEAFGFSINEARYKVLNPHVRVIQGDGVNPFVIDQILQHLAANGWAAENVVFGMGGALLQQPNRDDHEFALKASWVKVGKEERGIFKSPVTDGGKESKSGRFSVTRVGDSIITVNEGAVGRDGEDLLKTVFLNGHMIGRSTFDQVRERAAL